MNKRKKIFLILLVILCIGIYSYKKKSYTDNILTNVEALASSEGGWNHKCYFSGSVDCAGIKAEYSNNVR